MIVKVSKSSVAGVAILMSQDCTIREQVALDDTLNNKMCRRDRAYFQAGFNAAKELVLLKRLPNQGW